MQNDQSFIRRWESTRRYYTCRLQRDLLGDLVLDTVWGGKYNKLGGQHTQPVATWADGLAAISALERERLSRAYVPIG